MLSSRNSGRRSRRDAAKEGSESFKMVRNSELNRHYALAENLAVEIVQALWTCMGSCRTEGIFSPVDTLQLTALSTLASFLLELGESKTSHMLGLRGGSSQFISAFH